MDTRIRELSWLILVPVPPALTANFITGAPDVSQLLDPPWEALLPQRDAVLDRWRRELG